MGADIFTDMAKFIETPYSYMQMVKQRDNNL